MKNQILAFSILFFSVFTSPVTAQTTSLPHDVYVNPSWFAINAGDDPDGSGPATQTGVDAFSSITAAINAVDDGGVVHLSEGTYAEQIEISHNLSLIGSGNATIIQSPDNLTLSFNTGVLNKPIIWVHDTNDVRIQNLAIDGLGKGNENYRFMGIAYFNAGGFIDQVDIGHIEETPLSGNQHGIGIYVRNLTTAERAITITRSNIHDYQKNGMAIVGSHLTATIRNNTVTGSGRTTALAQNGIQLSYGANGIIENNTVRNNDCISEAGYCTLDPATSQDADTAAGILIFSPGSAELDISHNTLENNQCNLCALSYSYFTTATQLRLNLHDNMIDGGLLGLAIFDPDGTIPTMGTIQQNRIHHTQYGLFVRDDTPTTTQPIITALHNDITNNTPYGVWANVPLNAENNWWGCAGGSALTLGDCDAHTDSVDTNPWLPTPDLSGTRGAYFEFYPERRDFYQRTGDSWTTPIDIEWYANNAPIYFSSPNIPAGSGISFVVSPNPATRPASGSTSRIHITYTVTPSSPAPSYTTFLLRGQAGTVIANQLIEVSLTPGVVSGTGGVVGSGGILGTGGVTGSGGIVGTGGILGSGGDTGSGGSIGTGGLTGSGGSGSGGSSGSGGVSGSSGSGGVTSSGSISRGLPTPTNDTISYNGTFADTTGWMTPTITVTGVSRPALSSGDHLRVYRPSSRRTNLPLILIFPGTGSDTANFIDEIGANPTGLVNAFSPDEVVIAVLPHAYQPDGDWDHPWDAGYWNTAIDNINTNPDIAYTRAVIQEARRTYGIDPTRVYTFGHSSGGFFSEFVAEMLGDRIAGFAENSAGLVGCLTNGKKAPNPQYQSTSTSCDTILNGINSFGNRNYYTCTSSWEPFPSFYPGDPIPAYLNHANNDDAVSVYHSCFLRQQMLSRGSVEGTNLWTTIRNDGTGHSIGSGFLRTAWSHLRDRSL